MKADPAGLTLAMQVLIHVVSALFDINPSMSTHMLVHLWKKCVAVLLEVLDLLRRRTPRSSLTKPMRRAPN